ncbi:MAG: dicarboxylate/amino acid:cation symporter [Bacteroidales bacterium]|nr:dicarboxylate/amino acid:cation symporter [Bacteroidales bacterium]
MKIRIALHWQILLALVAGGFFGFFIPSGVNYVSWMGDLFLRGLKMVIIPLVFSTLVTGVAGVGSAGNLGRLGLKTMGFYLATSFLAILTGLILVNLIEPGTGASIGLVEKPETLGVATRSFGETLLGIVPENIFASLMNGDMLPIIFFSVLFGFFITRLSEHHSKPLQTAFTALSELMMRITLFIIRFTPAGVFGIVAKVISEQAGDQEALLAVTGRLGLYMITVLAGIFFHGFITLSIVLKGVAGIHPITHLRNMSSVLLTAFSTSSSNATLPLTISEIETRSKVSPAITGFTLPLGATINMNGTALYECVAVMFIAQAYGIELSLVQQMVVVATALLAAIGSAGIPMAGLVMMAIVMTAVGLPLEGIGLILAVDRILDMFRTALNVYGDTCAAVVIANSEGEIIEK